MSTPKTRVQKAAPDARADFSELLRGQGQPCFFIRNGLQGPFLHRGLYRSAKAAWKGCDADLRQQYLASLPTSTSLRKAVA